jgi:ubiquitin thioesterase OTU1
MENSNLIKIRIVYESFSAELNVDKNLTIIDLKSAIKSLCIKDFKLNSNLTEDCITLKYGFPPKTIQSESNNKLLSEANITHNETIRIEINMGQMKNPSTSNVNDKENTTNTNNNDPIDYSNFRIIRKIIAADNACLFNAVNYAVNKNTENADFLRELIAIEIQSNPDTYNEAVLEKTPEEYCQWICNKETWGGYIEVSILSKIFNAKIGVVDIMNERIEYFGEVNKHFLYNSLTK